MNKENAKIFEQDLNNKNKSSGTVFAVHLLMNKICSMPDKQLMQNIINKHLGETDCFCYDEKTAGFAVKKYSVNFEKDNGNIPPMLMITDVQRLKSLLWTKFLQVSCGTVRTVLKFSKTAGIRLLKLICLHRDCTIKA